MDIAFLLLKMRLKHARQAEAVSPAMAKYARYHGPTAIDGDKYWRRFERKCETLHALAPQTWHAEISAQLLAGLARPAATGKDSLTPLGMSLQRGCGQLGQRLIQGGASPWQVWHHGQTPEYQLWTAWRAQSAWAVAWLVGQDAPASPRLLNAVFAGGAPHLGLPILWSQAGRLPTEAVLRRLGLDTTQLTFLADPVTDIPLDALFITRKKEVFDVRELLRHVVSMRSFSNPFGGDLSSDEITMLCAHPAAAAFKLTPQGIPQPPLQEATVRALFALAIGLCAGWDDSLDTMRRKGLRFERRYNAKPTEAPATALGVFAAFRETLSPVERFALDAQEAGSERLSTLLHDVASYSACVKWTGYRVYLLACEHAKSHGSALAKQRRRAQVATLSARTHCRDMPGW